MGFTVTVDVVLGPGQTMLLLAMAMEAVDVNTTLAGAVPMLVNVIAGMEAPVPLVGLTPPSVVAPELQT